MEGFTSEINRMAFFRVQGQVKNIICPAVFFADFISRGRKESKQDFVFRMPPVFLQ